MYNIKEKNKHLRTILAVIHAEKDLQLLEVLAPTHELLDTFTASPQRNAEQILYTLLDFATAEEIRENRRDIELAGNTNHSVDTNKMVDTVVDSVEKIQELSPSAPKEPTPEPKPKAEKKSPSKKKPSTPTSNGKTSKTKTSK